MHKIEWREGGLQLADIGTKNVSEPDLASRMKYIMVRLEDYKTEHLYKSGVVYWIVMKNKSSELTRLD